MHMSKSNVTKKPFPWKCSNCREKAVREAVVDHSVEVEHDGRAYTVTVKRLKTPKCTNCGLVCPDSETQAAITLAFLVQARLLTGEQIRRDRERLGLTQKQLASAIGIAEATVSRWETGAQIQQRSLDNLLRIFFTFPDVRQALVDQRLAEFEPPKSKGPLLNSA